MFKKIVALLLTSLLLLSMTGSFAENLTVTDMHGREVSLSAPAQRIIALSAAECEIVAALGGDSVLVGRGAYCNYPETILSLPAVQSGSETNLEEILALSPDLVLTSDMGLSPETVAQLENSGVTVVTFLNSDIESAYEEIAIIGTLMGKTAEATALVDDMKATFAEIAAASSASDQTVYFEVSPLEWGLYTAGRGTFMDEIATLCGLTNAFADVDGWAAISEEQILERNPDYILSVAGIPDAQDGITARAGWDQVKAVQNNQVMTADADAFSRPGPRLKDAALSLFHYVRGDE